MARQVSAWGGLVLALGAWLAGSGPLLASQLAQAVPDLINAPTGGSSPAATPEGHQGPSVDATGPQEGAPQEAGEDPGATAAEAEGGDEANLWFVDLWRSWFPDAEEAPASPTEGPKESEGRAAPLFAPLPAVAFDEPVLEATEGDTVRVGITRSINLRGRVEVSWRLGAPDDSAEPGRDYRIANGVLTFEEGMGSGVIEVSLPDDNRYREPERRSLSIVITDHVGGRLAGADTARLTIVERSPAKPPPPPPASMELVGGQVEGGVLELGAQARASVKLRNRGGEAAEVTRVIPPIGTTVVQDGCAGQVVAPQQACVIEVVIAPLTPGRYQEQVAVAWRSTGPQGEAVILDVPVVADVVRPAPPADPDAERRQRALEARRRDPGIELSFAEPARAPSPPPEYRLSQPDYPDMGKAWWTLPVNLERVILTLKMIPCVLLDTINSQLPGPARCIVETPVYGHVGRLVLIPAGTVFEGQYAPLARNGDTRLNVAWQRGIRPDGSGFRIDDGLQALDAMGRAGLPGDVDTRVWDKYGSVGLLTLLNVGAALATPADDAKFSRAQQEMARNIGDVTAQVMEENLDLRPISTVPKGTRMHIKPLVDMWFPVPELLTPSTRPGSRLDG